MTWAVDKFDNDGGYLVIRWCRTSNHRFKWPHFLWLPADKHQHLQHVVPQDIENFSKKMIPSPWFDPQKLHGDGEDTHKDN
jgi:hypothetical protein